MSFTELEQRLLALIRQHQQDHGRSPTMAELAAASGLRSRGTVHRYVKSLIAKGALQSDPGVWRGMRLVEEGDGQPLVLPLMGRIAAGRPIEAIADRQEVNLSELLGGPQRFVLQVRGESMVDAGILDGDLVIIRRQQTAQDGDIVVALIDDEEATLKRLRHDHQGNVLLIPENASMAAMLYEPSRVQIQGILVAQLRSYS